MEIIFALDVKDSKVVHGVQGKRDLYLPPRNNLFGPPIPEIVVNSVIQKYGIGKFYVADLNSIMKNGNNCSSIDILTQKFQMNEFYIDAGIYDQININKYLNKGYKKVIIGLETLDNIERLQMLYQKYDNKILFSLDCYNGKPAILDKKLSNKKIDEIIRLVGYYGAKEIIILDIDNVGTVSGYNLNYIKLISNLSSNMDIYLAGGIRSVNEILKFRDLGIKGIIFASMIYNNLINRDEIKMLSEVD